MMYQHKLDATCSGKTLNIPNLRDRAHVMVDGVRFFSTFDFIWLQLIFLGLNSDFSSKIAILHVCLDTFSW